MVMARVQAGQRAALTSALDGLFADAGESSRSVFGVRRPDGGLRLAVAPRVGRQSPGSGRGLAVRRSHRRSLQARCRLADRLSTRLPVIAKAAGDDAPPIEFAGMVGMKYLFLEQRAPAGAEENEVTVTFQGARTGHGVVAG